MTAYFYEFSALVVQRQYSTRIGRTSLESHSLMRSVTPNFLFAHGTSMIIFFHHAKVIT